MVFAVFLFLMTAAAFSDKYMKRIEDETQRLIKIKKGPLVRQIRDLEPLIHRYEFIFNTTVLMEVDEDEKKQAFTAYMSDFPRKYAFDFDRYLIALDVCAARFPDDFNCESETHQIDWNYWHDFREEGAKEAHVKKLKGYVKTYLKELKKIDL